MEEREKCINSKCNSNTITNSNRTDGNDEDQRRKSSHHQAAKKWMFCLLERPNTRLALCYHTASLILIIGSLIVGVLDTVTYLEERLKLVVFYYELFLLIWFSTEFILRLWSSSYMSRYRGAKGRMSFIFSLYMMIDCFVILSTITTLILNNEVLDATYFPVLRATRFMQVFRLLRVDRQRGDIRTMGAVVRNHSKELITVYFVGFVIMFSATYIVYLCERHVLGHDASFNEEVTITNMVDGLYWAAITVTSVGYGDFHPVTWSGKLVCSIFALVGCAFFSLPAGILGTGFALQQKKEKRFIKVRNPAACLLQAVWRDYAMSRDNARFEATWHYFLSKLRDDDETVNRDNNRNSMMETIFDAKSSFPLPSPNLLKKQTEHFPPEKTHSKGIIGCESLGNLSSDENILPPKDKEQKVEKNGDLLSPLEDRIKSIGKLIIRGGTQNNFNVSNGQMNEKCATVLRRESIMVPKVSYGKLSSASIGGESCRMRNSGKNSFCSDTIRMVHQNGCQKNKIHEQIMNKYKEAFRFILKLKFFTAIKVFKNKRHPFVNLQDFMEKNSTNHSEMLSYVKSMRDSFNILNQELTDLRCSLAELKERNEK